ncbi:MAG: DJ-1/PfpI family protein [Cyanobacteria bacterium]|nr:DJ-1/PfpI family protein [Cyanobacteriota bacterium]MDA0865323.1 DJ-1/PfpI family protein [Cyanobacteriota bacterium]
MNSPKRTVGILIFPEVEVLDFAGPFEVFSRTRLVPGVASRRTDDSAPFQVFTVAKTTDTITAVGGLRVLPDYGFADAPKIDLLVVPGGFGTRPLLEDTDTLQWIQAVSQQAEQVTSVCTGALILAKLGLLANKRATTHWGALGFLAQMDPSIAVQRDQRVVADGIFTSAGVAAGIDMSLAVVELLCGQAVADETAHYIEFPRDRC